MKRTVLAPFFLLFVVLVFVSCRENIDERAAREAREYTEKFCPGPFINCSRVDSTAYNPRTRVYTYYYTFGGELDSPEYIAQNSATIDRELRQIVVNTPELQPFVQAGIRFRYVIRSLQDPSVVLFDTMPHEQAN